ncbi:MAG: ABC transporter permease [Chloroflexi bacterium]|nr:ABC transporter permease [Chloroflexota bacterium]
MLRYSMRRLAISIPVIVGLAVVVFLYIHLMPGDPIQAMVGRDASPELVQQIRHEFGLDRPLYEQFTDWVAGLLHGDLGITFRSRQPITPILLGRIPATIELAAGAFIVALLLGMPSGFLAGVMKDSKFDYIFSLVALAGLSAPLFWTGYLLMLALGVKWRVLPAMGYIPFTDDPGRNLLYLILPAFTLGFGMAPYIAKMTRTAVVETMQEPFVAFAEAKGLRKKVILIRYVLRHAIPSIAVVLGMDVGFLLGGQIVVEELFNWPGTGRLMVRAVIERDYFMAQATILVYAGVFIFVNFFAELLHAWLDPRVRLD